MRNIKLTLEYDGTDFAGWQFQENARSVQGILEKALKELLQEECRVLGAGRTDAGVHARGQVANFLTRSSMELPVITKGVNALLPEDIVVRLVEEAPEKFHARYSARTRRYSYRITTTPVALGRSYSWFVGYRLDLRLMQQCSAALVGTHDFQAFCKADVNVDHYRCEILQAFWKEDGEIMEFIVEANRFLYGMVRALVGTMVEVGRGYRGVEEFDIILKSKDRQKAGMAAPAKGLSLDAVGY